MSKTLTFENRVVVVTGAGNGIGRAYAHEFAKRGAKVVVNDLGGSVDGEGSDTKSADTVVEEITGANGHAVANYDSVIEGAKVIECAMDTWGKVDVLLNNAGIAYATPFSEMQPERWKRMLDVHVDGSYACSHAAWKHMLAQGYGRILFTTSPFGLHACAGFSHYSAAKAAMLGLTKALALEGKDHNIYSNAVAPYSASRMTGKTNQEQAESPVGPRFLAQFAVWLAHESCAENGSVFELGGGYVHKLRWQLSNALHLNDADYNAENIAAKQDVFNQTDAALYPELGDFNSIGKQVFGSAVFNPNASE